VVIRRRGWHNSIVRPLTTALARDVVDLHRLELAGFRVEQFLADAQRKDAGVTPAALAWALSEVTVPDTIASDVDPQAVRAFVRDLESRMRRLSAP
jgi:hypothetical protein